MANGELRDDHPPFKDFYATPIHKVSGPFGWPSYVAKASLGIAPVESDGSANFYAPAGKVLYFEALDEDFNEIQRMRSVVQLQPGEKRSCIGCHEDRKAAPPVRQNHRRASRTTSRLELPPWGTEPFSYEKSGAAGLGRQMRPLPRRRRQEELQSRRHARSAQSARLVSNADRRRLGPLLRLALRGVRPHKAEPASFGTLKSKLWPVLDKGHYDVKLTREEMRRVKCWIDLNCPPMARLHPSPKTSDPTEADQERLGRLALTCGGPARFGRSSGWFRICLIPPNPTSPVVEEIEIFRSFSRRVLS